MSDVVDFTSFLASHGYISEVDAERVRQRVRNEGIPLGKVLVMAGMLSIKSVRAVLEAQLSAPEQRFGEVAIKLGFITPEQLGEALRRQAEVRVHPAQAVLDLELLDEERWREAMIEYCKLQESRVPG